VNRVTRHTLGDDDLVVAGSEVVLVDNIPSPATNHNGGDLHFGTDGLLYVSVGDGGCTIGNSSACAAANTNARRLDIPSGKVLRITKTGAVPSTNPFAGAAGGRHCTAPSGVRRGRARAQRPTPPASATPTGWRASRHERVPCQRRRSNTWEEVDALQAGADYGWNVREGFCATGSTTSCGATSYQNPIHAYGHSTGCQSITGGAWVPEGLWPAPYSGSYLYADFVCNKVFRLAADGSRHEFLTNAVDPTQLTFGPWGSTQALYWLEYFGGKVHRVTHATTNTAPVASFTSRPNGLTVAFNGAASYDPDGGDKVTRWKWSFGDGTSAETTTPTVQHTYATKQVYTATLRVVDSRGSTSAPVSRAVYAGEYPPTVAITSPSKTTWLGVGSTITVTGRATDREDGVRPITWVVWLRHGNHWHPFRSPVTAASITVTFPSPEDLAATTNSYLLVGAWAKDSRGLGTMAYRYLLPWKVPLTFTTSPARGAVVVGGVRRATPVTITSWARHSIAVSAPDQTIGGLAYRFSSWSDGGARTHTVVTPWRATTYTARFVR
jgi:PKD repeat protein